MNSSGESAAREPLTVGGETKCKNCEQPKSAHLISGHIYCPISLGRACWYEPVDAATPALVEAREQWMLDAAEEIADAFIDDGLKEATATVSADIIARHYAAREREEWIPCEVRMPPQYHSALITHIETRDGSPTVEEARWDGERWCLARTDPQDNMIYLDEQVSAWREIPAPFAAKGETE